MVSQPQHISVSLLPYIQTIEGETSQLHHGTCSDRAQNIVAYGFKASPGDTFMGPGVYVWGNDIEMAKWWSSKRKPCKEISVIEVTAKLGAVLTINSDSQLFIDDFQREMKKIGYYVEPGVALDLIVRRVLPKQKIVVNTVKSIHTPHINYCIKDPALITRTQIIYTGKPI